jgi:hypothetical protein
VRAIALSNAFEGWFNIMWASDPVKQFYLICPIDFIAAAEALAILNSLKTCLAHG